jgi:hypothetical protein
MKYSQFGKVEAVEDLKNRHKREVETTMTIRNWSLAPLAYGEESFLFTLCRGPRKLRDWLLSSGPAKVVHMSRADDDTAEPLLEASAMMGGQLLQRPTVRKRFPGRRWYSRGVPEPGRIQAKTPIRR